MLRSCLRAAALAVPAAALLAILATPSFAVQRTVTIYQIQDTTAVGHVVEGSTDTVTTTGVITGQDVRGTGFGFHIQDTAGGNFSGVLVFTGGANVFTDSAYARGDLITATGRCLEFGGTTELTSRTGNAFSGVPTTTKIGTAAIPAPIALSSFGQYSETASYLAAEKFESVLISITNGRNVRYPIFSSGTSASFLTGSWLVVDNAIPGANDSIQIDGFTLCVDNAGAPAAFGPPAVGVVATSVKGIGTQGTRGYRLQLRDNGDIVVPAPPSLLNAYATTNTAMRLQFDKVLDATTAQNTANYSRPTSLGSIQAATLVGGVGSQTVELTCTTDPMTPDVFEDVTASGVKSNLGVVMTGPGTQGFIGGITPITSIQTNYTVNPPFHPAPSDSSHYTFSQVTFRGVCTGKDGSLHYMQQGNSVDPSSAVAVFAPISGLAEGDDVTFSGVVTEFGTASQLTEFSGVDYQFENATGVALPAAVVRTPGSIGPLTGSEPFVGEAVEAMLVQMNGVTVVQDSLPNGQYLVQGSGGTGDTVRVDDTMYHNIYAAGTMLNITGLVNDAFGQFTVQPRRASDIDSLGIVGVPGVQLPESQFALRSIAPTPVSFARGGSAIVRFSMPTAGKVSARVYDLAGRLVATPASDVSYDAGSQSLTLDGRTSNGGRLGSGIFFVQLNFGNRVATGKLVVTE